MRKVWSFGERKFEGDFRKRKMIFNYLVRSVMEYAVEIWGWKEVKELEKIQVDYLRWILRLDFCTPRYLIYKETDSRKLKIGWSKRAVKFEEKVGKMGDERLVKMCFLEKMEQGEKDRYSLERKKYYNSLGLSTKEVENMKKAEKIINVETETRESDIDRQTTESKIRVSKYNKRYKYIATEQLPAYLKGWRNEKDIQLVAKLRCGNFEEKNRYWLNNDETY